MYDKIDAILAKKNLSRRQLAFAAGISENTLAGAFRRKTKNFAVENVMKIADVLGVDWLELAGYHTVAGDELLEFESKNPSLYKHASMPKKHEALVELTEDKGYGFEKFDVEGMDKYVLVVPGGMYPVSLEDVEAVVQAAEKAALLQMQIIAHRAQQAMLVDELQMDSTGTAKDSQ